MLSQHSKQHSSFYDIRSCNFKLSTCFRITSTQVSHKHSCFSWWWAHSRLKHVEIDKYKCTKNKLCTELVLFTRLYKYAPSTKHEIQNINIRIQDKYFEDSLDMETKLTSFSHQRNFCDCAIVFTSTIWMISYCNPVECSLHPRFELCNSRSRVDINTFIIRLAVIIFPLSLSDSNILSLEHFVLQHNLFYSELWSGSGYPFLFIVIYNGC
jgi:hypothetical protein